jgi:hypothetical protein
MPSPPSSFSNFVISPSSPQLLALTVDTNLNRFLVVDVEIYGAFNSIGAVTGVTFNGIACSFLQAKTSLNPHNKVRIEQWCLIAPPSGTHNVSVSFSGSCQEIAIQAYQYSDIDPEVNPIDISSLNGNTNVVQTTIHIPYVNGIIHGGIVTTDSYSVDGPPGQITPYTNHNTQVSHESTTDLVQAIISDTDALPVGDYTPGFDIVGANDFAYVALVLVPVPHIVLSILAGFTNRITLWWTGTAYSSYDIYKFDDLYGVWRKVYNTSNTIWEDFNVSVGPVYQYFVIGVTIDGIEHTPSNIVTGQLQRGGFSMSGIARARQYQGIQFGVEDPSTPGTLVAATKRLVGMEIDVNPEYATKTVVYAGVTGAVGTQKGQKFSTAKFTGVGSYNNLTLLFSLAFGVVTPTLSNNGETWNWQPSSVQPWSPSSATFEIGSSAGSEKFGWGTLADITLKTGQNEFSIDGTLFGGKQVRDATMTPNIVITLPAAAAAATSLTVTCLNDDGTTANGQVIPAGTYTTSQGKIVVVTAPATVSAGGATLTVTALAALLLVGDKMFTIPAVPCIPFDPDVVGWYLSTDGVTYTAIGTSMDGTIVIGNLWKQHFLQNETDTFGSIKQLAPAISATLSVEEGTNADDFIGYIDSGTLVWLGLKVTGPQINASPLVKYSFRLNIPMYITKPDPGNKDDVQGNTFTFEHAFDQGKLFDLTIVSKLAVIG